MNLVNKLKKFAFLEIINIATYTDPEKRNDPKEALIVLMI